MKATTVVKVILRDHSGRTAPFYGLPTPPVGPTITLIKLKVKLPYIAIVNQLLQLISLKEDAAISGQPCHSHGSSCQQSIAAGNGRVRLFPNRLENSIDQEDRLLGKDHENSCLESF